MLLIKISRSHEIFRDRGIFISGKYRQRIMSNFQAVSLRTENLRQRSQWLLQQNLVDLGLSMSRLHERFHYEGIAALFFSVVVCTFSPFFFFFFCELLRTFLLRSFLLPRSLRELSFSIQERQQTSLMRSCWKCAMSTSSSVQRNIINWTCLYMQVRYTQAHTGCRRLSPRRRYIPSTLAWEWVPGY